jgi:23S rRNA pseudouridine2457 synthase
MPRHYILLNKPYGVICQFSSEGNHQTLAALGPFPPDVYPAGRLDADSEGLVLLTNDNDLKHRIMEPRFAHPRTYLVQVEGIPTREALDRLRHGVRIQQHLTGPARVALLDQEPDLPPRTIPIRYRKEIPTSWLRITLGEGKNRQVRRMTAAVGYPTLRLVRTAIGSLTIDGLAPGMWRALKPEEREGLLRHGMRAEPFTHSFVVRVGHRVRGRRGNRRR